MSLLQKTIRADVQATNAYVVAPSAGMLKLDAMENPQGMPAALLDKLAQQLKTAELNRYPAPKALELEAALRACTAIPKAAHVLFGNGSDEIIALLISTCIITGRGVCAPDPSFVMFQAISNQYQVPFSALSLNESFDIDIDAWKSQLAEKNPGLVFVPQPNNPTGNLFSKDHLEIIVQQNQTLFVIDEAYTAFTDADYLDWAIRFPNVLIMRTLSKVGLAGSRFGMLIGAPEWIREFEKMDNLAQFNMGEFEVSSPLLPDVVASNLVCVQYSETDLGDSLVLSTKVLGQPLLVTIRTEGRMAEGTYNIEPYGNEDAMVILAGSYWANTTLTGYDEISEGTLTIQSRGNVWIEGEVQGVLRNGITPIRVSFDVETPLN